MGENARMEWQAYQEREKAERGDEPQAVERETQRLQEMGLAGAGTSGSAPPAPPEVDTPEEETAETGTPTDRERAEARAAELGLEVRAYGDAGDWRVYDPKTGRQVAKSTVLG